MGDTKVLLDACITCYGMTGTGIILTKVLNMVMACSLGGCCVGVASVFLKWRFCTSAMLKAPAITNGNGQFGIPPRRRRMRLRPSGSCNTIIATLSLLLLIVVSLFGAKQPLS